MVLGPLAVEELNHFRGMATNISSDSVAIFCWCMGRIVAYLTSYTVHLVYPLARLGID
jgi:hypothetical protein